ncbi:MAG: acyl carrier protein [Nannocystaceae bacterium]|nr:acyl carrier protein [Nannocystaceae bacterium]
MSSSLDRLMQVASKRYDVELASLRPEDDVFEKLGIDSFQAVELMSELELEFDVEIPDYELQGVRTFAQLAATIDKRR